MHLIFAPAIRWMEHLSLAKKMLTVAAVCAVPLIVFSYLVLQATGENIQLAQREKEGTAFLKPTFSLLQHVQQHRGAAAALLAGDRSFQTTVEQKAQAIEQDIQAIDSADRRYGARFGVSRQWQQWKQGWQELRRNLHHLSVTRSTEQHTALVQQLLQIQQAIADASSMSLDPEIDTYYVMYTFAFVLPPATEYMGQARAIGMGAIASKDISTTRDRLVALSTLIQDRVATTHTSLDKVIHADPTLRSRLGEAYRQYQVAVDKFTTVLNDRLLKGEVAGITPQDYFRLATEAIDCQFVLINQLSQQFDVLLDRRIARLNMRRCSMLMIALVPVLIAAWLYGGFYLAIRRGVQQLLYISQKMAVGDLQLEMKMTGSKEEINQISQALGSVLHYMQQLAHASQRIAQGDLTVQLSPQSERDALGNAFAEMTRSLRQMVCQLGSGAEQLSSFAQQISSASVHSAQASGEVARGSEQLAQQATEAAQAMDNLDRAIRTVQQGSETQREAAQQAEEGMRQAAQAVEEVARSAQQMAASAQQASAIAQQGGQSVQEMLHTMRQIQEQAEASAQKVAQLDQLGQQIGNIVQTIEQIAEQTNLLALNAAIEAARAGEHGRGFAVVADEVRKLAEQAGAATKEIATLIGNVRSGVEEAVRAMQATGAQVSDGFARSEQVGSALMQIVESAQQVAGEVQSVTAVAEQMSASVQQVLATVSTVLQSAEENARAALEMVSGSEQVSSAIASVASISEEAAASAEELNASSEEVAAAAQELLQMSYEMRNLASRFVVQQDSSSPVSARLAA
ncbi:MAG: hypothetical protein KatS3mg023_0240 [Armatimonadota bacterium]|nr:MAG: hypothetical protein KatS3mg023_0240 [Armatimonadota bacterium]